jgi:hypothetical protein
MVSEGREEEERRRGGGEGAGGEEEVKGKATNGVKTDQQALVQDQRERRKSIKGWQKGLERERRRETA